jgi:hypothetical protein
MVRMKLALTRTSIALAALVAATTAAAATAADGPLPGALSPRPFPVTPPYGPYLPSPPPRIEPTPGPPPSLIELPPGRLALDPPLGPESLPGPSLLSRQAASDPATRAAARRRAEYLRQLRERR